MRTFGAYPIYLLLSGALSLGNSMLWAVETVYLINAVGLNPVQIVLVGTVLLCVHLLFQTPTGILADMYSRRLAVVVGLFVLGAGHTPAWCLCVTRRLCRQRTPLSWLLLPSGVSDDADAGSR